MKRVTGKMSLVVALGDSLTYGYGIPRGYGWVERLAKSFPQHDFYNYGALGDTTHGMAVRLTAIIQRLKPDYLLLMGGTNDLLEGFDENAALEMIAYMEKVCRRKHVKMIILSPPDIQEIPGVMGWFDESEAPGLRKKIRNLRELQKEYAKKNDVPFISTDEALKDLVAMEMEESENTIFLEDGVHLTIDAHEMIAYFVEDFLRSILV